MKLSVAIIAKSEKISKQVLDSISFADEIIIVVDSPKKKAISKGKVSYHFRPLDGDFAAQRNFAIDVCQGDWILFIDADEYVGTELSAEISKTIIDSDKVGYFIHRADVCFHQEIRFGETGKTKILRLARRNAGKFVRPVHEYWKVKGEIGLLDSPLYHIKDNLVSEFVGRMSHYAGIDSEILTKEGKPFSYFRLLFFPKAKFIQNYFYRLGFLDGLVGLFQAYLMSIQSLTVRIFQWEKLR